MKKTFVLVTRSYKYGGYCVAGFDLASKGWIRLVSTADLAGNEIPKSLFEDFEDLDILEVETLGAVPIACQTENVLLAPAVRPVRSGRLSLYELLGPACLCTTPAIFGKALSSLTQGEIAAQRSSLGLFKVDDLHFDYVSDEQKMHYRGSFFYRGTEYRGLSVTDPVYRRDEFAGQSVEHALVVVSLPALPYSNGKYYKFIAKIFPITAEMAERADALMAPPEPAGDAAFAEHFLLSLAAGRDPDTGEALDPQRILSPQYAGCLRRCAALIAGRKGGSPTRVESAPPRPAPLLIDEKCTYLLRKRAKEVGVTDEAVTASALAERVNALREPYGRGFTAAKVGAFFLAAGMLEKPSGCSKRLPTKLGERHGIIAEPRISERGVQYFAVTYGREAQQFFVDHLERCVVLLDEPSPNTGALVGRKGDGRRFSNRHKR